MADQRELENNLTEYNSQLQQVEQLLLAEPENQEYAEIFQSLTEVIDLTKELLREAQQTTEPSSSAGPSSRPQAVTTTAPQILLPSILPPQVASQIRAAQQKAALSGQAPPAWAIGAKCHALYADGQHYEGNVTGVTAAGNFIVHFAQFNQDEEVIQANIGPPPEVQEVYQGVAAPRRNKVEEAPSVGEMPKWLAVKDTDDDKTRNRKRKLQKSFKSKMRFQQLDMEVKNRQSSWLNFKKGKGAKKKTGFLSGRQKESMFSVPEGLDSKVGVIGSGKGMTESINTGRHDFEAGGA
ncbi:hypothetical protein WJX73_006622 [Symbiochloris irregularis]|uniref:Tudor domain-containing protein n=1 Tax=Symbiochloris irregularis TaxID=706552 RepID=A0AAW1PTF8_9CHLO